MREQEQCLVLGTQACWSQPQRVSSYLPVPQSVQDEDQQTLLTRTRKMSDRVLVVGGELSAGPPSVELVISAFYLQDGDASAMYGPATSSRWRTGIR